MRTTNVRGDHDDEVVDLVTRTLGAVAEATPVADEPFGAHDLVAAHSHSARVRRGRARTPRRGRVRRGQGRTRVVAVAAAAAAAVVTVVAFVTVEGGGDQGVDSPPAGPEDSTTPHPAIRMQAGWLPTGFDEEPSTVERSPGLDVPVEAAMWGGGYDEVVVVAAIDLGDRGGDRNMVRRRTETVRSALEGVLGPLDPELVATATSDQRGAVAVARTQSLTRSPADVEAIAARIAEGTPPTEAFPAGGEATVIPLGWAPGVGASVTVQHRVVDQSHSGAVSVVVVDGELPEALTMQQLFPGGLGAEVRGHRAVRVFPIPTGRSWLVWQEEPGVVVIMTGPLTDGELLRVAEGLVPVEEPAVDAEASPEVVDEGTVGGATYRIDRTSEEGPGRGWCASVVVDGDAVRRPLCQNMAYGSTDGPSMFFPVAEVDGGTLWWGSAPPGTATVSVEGVNGSDSRAETVEGAPDGHPDLPVTLVVVPDDVGSPTFAFHGVDGEPVGTSSFSGDVPFG